jgi:hypothetical protein
MCECKNWKDNTCQVLVPANTNFRHFAKQIWENEAVKAEKTWYGIEQEYTMISNATKFTT